MGNMIKLWLDTYVAWNAAPRHTHKKAAEQQLVTVASDSPSPGANGNNGCGQPAAESKG